jgi:hypothetical protein
MNQVSSRIAPLEVVAMPGKQKGLEGNRYFYNMSFTVRQLSLSNWAFPGHSRTNQTKSACQSIQQSVAL